jgi:predicted TIM-barrel fold metal-dependent hydrolase
MARIYRLISSDSHLEAPPERWAHRIPERHRDRAPRTVRLPDGGEAIAIEGLPPQEIFFLDHRAGRALDQWGPFGLSREGQVGTGPPDERLKEMETDGLDAEVLFPSETAGPGLWRRIKDDEAYTAIVRAYNDWLAEEYCSVAPDRLIGVGVIPMAGLDAAIAELEHCASLGLKAIVLGDWPSGKCYPTLEDDTFWGAALDIGMPVAVHVAFGGFGPPRKPTFKYPREDPEIMGRLQRGFVDWVASLGLPPTLSLTQLALCGVFDRLPDLRIFFAEARPGWVPFWLERADLWYQLHLPWAQRYLGFEPVQRLPSEYVRRHVSFSVQYERVAVELRHWMGVDRLMFATDFPHVECEWPNSRSIVERIYGDVPRDERDRIWARNAVEFFKLG